MGIQRPEWQPTPVHLLRKFHGQRSLVGYSPHCNPGRTLFHFPAGGAEDAPCTRPGEIAPRAAGRRLGGEKENPVSLSWMPLQQLAAGKAPTERVRQAGRGSRRERDPGRWLGSVGRVCK